MLPTTETSNLAARTSISNFQFDHFCFEFRWTSNEEELICLCAGTNCNIDINSANVSVAQQCPQLELITYCLLFLLLNCLSLLPHNQSANRFLPRVHNKLLWSWHRRSSCCCCVVTTKISSEHNQGFAYYSSQKESCNRLDVLDWKRNGPGT